MDIGNFIDRAKLPSQFVISEIKDHWINGIYKGYAFSAKVYSEPSEYGIKNGCVSKLQVLKKDIIPHKFGWGRKNTAYKVDRGDFDGPEQDHEIGEEIAGVIDKAISDKPLTND